MTLKIVNGRIPNFNTMTLDKKNLWIQNGKIVWIGDEGDVHETNDILEEIDAKGKIVSPGFIDIHMHEETFESNSVSGLQEDDYFASYYELKMGVTTCVAGNCGNNRQSVADFIERIEREGAPVNYMTFLGHNYLRKAVGILDPYRAASSLEIEKMKALIDAHVKYGIIGLSFGIEYSPGISFDEMKALANALPDKAYLLSAHFRKDADGAVDSIEELIELSRATGCPMQISHIGSCSAYGTMKESLELIEKSRNEGVDVMADCYPYDAFATFIGSAVFDEGCFERWQSDYSAILLTEEPYKNKRCDSTLFYEVRKTYPNMIVAAFVMNESEVIKAIQAPFVLVGSDSLYKRDQGHPRGAGTFPRVLSKYVREWGALDLVNALWKMTLGPAKRLHLSNKGAIEMGKDADLVIFDPEHIEDLASFSEPTLAPKGIEYVIIKGEIAVKEGVVLKSRLGKYMPYNR
ncbi:N-acyl-D-amino-acid deacylase family protein [Fusibacter ferrireducens]|uniref:Amidohydrolase family protein n=1 Tax=Fusibacter ferrireducens TaxID=2785058 RepID=A0ABS0A028_9FIRM|nr:amidohydrolase family protein [Fusibacter ferrireducens]MBF4695490.1 amidohydrolase family protein [Fusibacter ferrireducens]